MENQSDFAELEARTRRLKERLESAPLVDLVGLVGASPPGAGRSRGETLWTMLLGLEAWRVDSGEMQTRRMTAKRPVTEDELHTLQKSIKPYSILRARARIVDDPQFVRPEAVLEEITTTAESDVQLSEYAHKLQLPLTYEYPVFGLLTLDRQIDAYGGHAEWNGSSVRISISDDSKQFMESLSTLRKLWLDQQEWAKRISDYAVTQLLSLKNDSWLGEDEAMLTADEFQARMKLDCISVDGESFTLWHKDGDMFGGHAIEIWGNLNSGPISADIPG